MGYSLNNIPFEDIKRELPGELVELSCIIPERSIVNLIESYGGQVIYIPAKMAPGSQLEKVIGKSAAKKICDSLNGETLSVPSLRRLRNRFRDQEIFKHKSDGMSNAELASRFKLSVRRIKAITSAMRYRNG